MLQTTNMEYSSVISWDMTYLKVRILLMKLMRRKDIRMCNVVYYSFQFVYGFFNTVICKKVGMKKVMIVGMFLFTVGFILFFFVSNKFAYLFICLPLSFGNFLFNALHYAVVSLVIPTEDLAGNFGVLICAGVIGQQISNFAVGSGMGAIWPNNSRILIGLSSIFAFGGFISSFFMINPKEGEINQYYKIVDNSVQESSVLYNSENN